MDRFRWRGQTTTSYRDHLEARARPVVWTLFSICAQIFAYYFWFFCCQTSIFAPILVHLFDCNHRHERYYSCHHHYHCLDDRLHRVFPCLRREKTRKIDSNRNHRWPLKIPNNWQHQGIGFHWPVPTSELHLHCLVQSNRIIPEGHLIKQIKCQMNKITNCY